MALDTLIDPDKAPSRCCGENGLWGIGIESRSPVLAVVQVGEGVMVGPWDAIWCGRIGQG